MNELYEQLASDFRPMLREIMEKYLKTEGYVGLLFDGGGEEPFVAFAEAVHPTSIDPEQKSQAEVYPYQYCATESFFRKHFREMVFPADKPVWLVHLPHAELQCQTTEDILDLKPLVSVYRDIIQEPLAFWRLCLNDLSQGEKPGLSPALYLYFFDVRGCLPRNGFDTIRDSAFFLAHTIRSVLRDYQFVHHDTPHYVAKIQDLLSCMQHVVELASVKELEEVRQEFIRKEAEIQSQRIFAHDMDSVTGIFDIYRDALPDDVKMAADYLLVWYRMAKRQMHYPLPSGLATIFADKQDLLKCVLRLAHARAENRGVLPRLKGDFVSVDDLLRFQHKWLCFDYDPSTVQRIEDTHNADVANCVKTYLLYLLIGALYHSVDYAFTGAARRFQSWDNIDLADRKAAVSIALTDTRTEMILTVRNVSGPDGERSTMFNEVLSSMTIGQNLSPHIYQRTQIKVEQARLEGEPESDLRKWVASIHIGEAETS